MGCNCGVNRSNGSSESSSNADEKQRLYLEEGIKKRSYDIEMMGHEFIWVEWGNQGAITHHPDCKFCIEKKINNIYK